MIVSPFMVSAILPRRIPAQRIGFARKNQGFRCRSLADASAKAPREAAIFLLSGRGEKSQVPSGEWHQLDLDQDQGQSW